MIQYHMALDKSLQLRLDKYIVKSDNECWTWIGAINGNTGVTTIKGKSVSVKKLLYVDFYGEFISSGYLHAKCKNRKCVNPKHLLNREQYFMTFFQINIESGCWEWTGKTRGGYGMFSVNHKNCLAHRLMYIKYKGPIPPNKNVCHSCDNPICVNPNHLWLGTQQENIEDMIEKKRDLKSYGEKHHTTKITEQDVRNIRLHKNEGLNMKQIHRLLNIPYRTIQHVCAGETWKHVKD